jgi:hypothetical protein
MMPQAVHTMRGPNPTKAFVRASDRRSAPLRGGRSVGRGSARANWREHDLLTLVRRAVRRVELEQRGKMVQRYFVGLQLLGVT